MNDKLASEVNGFFRPNQEYTRLTAIRKTGFFCDAVRAAVVRARV